MPQNWEKGKNGPPAEFHKKKKKTVSDPKVWGRTVPRTPGCKKNKLSQEAEKWGGANKGRESVGPGEGRTGGDSKRKPYYIAAGGGDEQKKTTLSPKKRGKSAGVQGKKAGLKRAKQSTTYQRILAGVGRKKTFNRKRGEKKAKKGVKKPACNRIKKRGKESP